MKIVVVPAIVPRCEGVIDLETPSGSERVRGFQPPWRTVWLYHCPVCTREIRVRANSFRGPHPVPSRGAIRCGRVL
jgi:hypothetical protein